MQVRIVLRDRQTGLYYRGDAEWAKNAYDALTFHNILEAEEYCRTHRLEGVQLIQQSGYFHRPLRYARSKPTSKSSALKAIAILFVCACYC